MPRFPRQAGAYAEYVTAPSRHFARKPAGLSHVEAAALPLAGLTAWQALVDTADVQPGQRVLIHAGGRRRRPPGRPDRQGARRARGRHRQRRQARVLARPRRRRARSTTPPTDFATGRAMSTSCSTPSAATTARARWRCCARAASYLSIVSRVDDRLSAAASARGLRARSSWSNRTTARSREIAALVDRGRLRVTVDAALPLADAAKAHELGAAGRTTGKLVLRVA